MAADVWKVKDMFGRVFLYENEKSFLRRLKTSLGDYHERIVYITQHNNPNVWQPQQVEGFRIENDKWVQQSLDNEDLKKYIEKRQERAARREARSRGYRF